jgi:hypothetical protein
MTNKKVEAGSMGLLKDALGNFKAPKVVRVVGDLKRVRVKGKTFEKQEYVYVHSFGLIKCVDYGNHFVFKDDRHKGWILFCSCGGPSIILNHDNLTYGMTVNKGAFLACLSHAQTGRHADGSQ